MTDEQITPAIERLERHLTMCLNHVQSGKSAPAPTWTASEGAEEDTTTAAPEPAPAEAPAGRGPSASEPQRISRKAATERRLSLQQKDTPELEGRHDPALLNLRVLGPHVDDVIIVNEADLSDEADDDEVDQFDGDARRQMRAERKAAKQRRASLMLKHKQQQMSGVSDKRAYFSPVRFA